MSVKIIECPRDAMQGLSKFVQTEDKILYINKLVDVGFDFLDCVSFVSPKSVPQMRDSNKVITQLNSSSKTSFIAIVANLRGAQNAVLYPNISVVGFPFSVSSQFQLRNTNKSQEQSVQEVIAIKQELDKHNKEMVLYLSMCFGNPYKEDWSISLVLEWVKVFADLGIRVISLSDTVGIAKNKDIFEIFTILQKEYPAIEFGAHLHTRPHDWELKLEAAYTAGCRRFDGAMNGLGGCPFATDSLTGNLSTENLIHFLSKQGVKLDLNMDAFEEARMMATRILG